MAAPEYSIAGHDRLPSLSLLVKFSTLEALRAYHAIY
jgi:hypothetical protein